MAYRKKVKESEGEAEAELDQSKIVEAAIASIKKNSNTTFFRMGDKVSELRPVLPTGIFGIDHYVIGAGGLPQGRIVEIYGAPSAGKGTLVLQAIAETQRRYPSNEVAYVDAEHALDPVYSSTLGVDMDQMLIAQPSCGEDALQAVLDIVSTGRVKLAIVDSVASLTPRAELEGSISDAHMGLQARMLGQALRKLTAVVSNTNTTLVFINQTRSNLGVTFGSPTTTPGGKALPFFSSLRLSVDRIQQVKDKDENVGNVTKIRAAKNKTSIPFKEMNVNLLFGSGFDNLGSLADLAIKHNVWQQSGANYTLVSTGETVRGRNNLRDALRDDTAVRRITEEATLVAMGKEPKYIERALHG